MPVRVRPRAFQEAFFARNPNARSVMGLFDYLPSIYYYAKDRESRFIKVNTEMLTIYDLKSEEDMLGRTDREFHPPALANAYIAEDQRVMAGRQPLPNQVWLVPQLKGTPRWYVSSKTPLFGPNGGVVGIAGVMYPIDVPESLRAHFQELLPVIRHIDRHYREQISMGAMATLAGLSATHFNRRFRTLLRMAPTEYLLMLRVQEARRLLTTTGNSMAAVAAETGFYDQSHFTRKFRRVTGMTPLAYRRRFR